MSETGQNDYPKVSDWVTPFTTKAHKYNINLVIKNKEIIAAYRDGVERIDETVKDEDIKLLLEYKNKTHDDSDLTLIQNFYKQGNRQTPLVVIGDQKADMPQLLALGMGEIKSISIMTAVVGIKHHGEEGKHGVIEINSTARPSFNNLEVREHAIITPQPDDDEPKKKEDVSERQKWFRSMFINGSYPISEHNSYIYIGTPFGKDYLKVSANGETLQEGIDYTVNEEKGFLTVLNKDLIKAAIPVKVEFKDPPHLLNPTMALYPGCDDAECSKTSLLEYLYKNIKYPKSLRTNLVQGTNYVGIHIDEDGILGEGFTIYESSGIDANAEFMSVFDGLKEKGRWTPRMVNGRSTSTAIIIPITFRLQDEHRALIDYKKSTFDVPDRYDVIFDEIVVTGFAKSSKN